MIEAEFLTMAQLHALILRPNLVFRVGGRVASVSADLKLSGMPENGWCYITWTLPNGSVQAARILEEDQGPEGICYEGGHVHLKDSDDEMLLLEVLVRANCSLVTLLGPDRSGLGLRPRLAQDGDLLPEDLPTPYFDSFKTEGKDSQLPVVAFGLAQEVERQFNAAVRREKEAAEAAWHNFDVLQRVTDHLLNSTEVRESGILERDDGSALGAADNIIASIELIRKPKPSTENEH